MLIEITLESDWTNQQPEEMAIRSEQALFGYLLHAGQ